MSHNKTDFTKKIRYAEEWLNKAKSEFEKGASVQAGGHLILAIAEMEHLKRTLFEESAPLNIKDTVPKRYIDFRPLIAAALIFLAFTIVSYTFYAVNNEQNRVPMVASSEFNQSSSERGFPESKLAEFLSVSYAETEIMPTYEESVSEYSDVSEAHDVPVEKSTSVVKPVTVKRSTNRITKPDSSVQPVVALVEKPSVIEPTAESTDKKPDLRLEEIQLNTIIAARESLNSE